MYLKKNPFHLLSVYPYSNREIIIKQADDKAFFMDNETTYKDAERTLLSPLKRVTAEVTYLPGLPENYIKTVADSVDADNKISLENMNCEYNSITEMNIAVHNFQLCKTALSLTENIVRISSAFEGMTFSVAESIINADRAIAGFTPLTEDEYETGFSFLKNELYNIVDAKVKELSEDVYVDFVYSAIENTVSNKVFGSIVKRLISNYADDMEHILDKKYYALNGHIKRLSSFGDQEKLLALSDEFVYYAKVLMKGYRQFGRRYNNAEDIVSQLIDIIQDCIDKNLFKEANSLLVHVKDRYSDQVGIERSFARKIEKFEEILENADFSDTPKIRIIKKLIEDFEKAVCDDNNISYFSDILTKLITEFNDTDQKNQEEYKNILLQGEKFGEKYKIKMFGNTQKFQCQILEKTLSRCFYMHHFPAENVILKCILPYYFNTVKPKIISKKNAIINNIKKYINYKAFDEYNVSYILRTATEFFNFTEPFNIIKSHGYRFFDPSELCLENNLYVCMYIRELAHCCTLLGCRSDAERIIKYLKDKCADYTFLYSDLYVHIPSEYYSHRELISLLQFYEEIKNISDEEVIFSLVNKFNKDYESFCSLCNTPELEKFKKEILTVISEKIYALKSQNEKSYTELQDKLRDSRQSVLFADHIFAYLLKLDFNVLKEFQCLKDVIKIKDAVADIDNVSFEDFTGLAVTVAQGLFHLTEKSILSEWNITGERTEKIKNELSKILTEFNSRITVSVYNYFSALSFMEKEYVCLAVSDEQSYKLIHMLCSSFLSEIKRKVAEYYDYDWKTAFEEDFDISFNLLNKLSDYEYVISEIERKNYVLSRSIMTEKVVNGALDFYIKCGLKDKTMQILQFLKSKECLVEYNEKIIAEAVDFVNKPAETLKTADPPAIQPHDTEVNETGEFSPELLAVFVIIIAVIMLLISFFYYLAK